eukprot:14454131-Ditylum_brightwellii.AAC.1
MATPSICGFSSGLNIIDPTSRKLWAFLTSAKRPPIHTIRSSLHAFATEGKVVRCIIMDADRSLACCAKFTSMIVDEFPGITLKTTGGYVSWIHGNSERVNETLNNGTQAVLFDVAKDVIYWCHAYTVD